MNSSRLKSSRYLVFLTIGVSGFTMLMYFHLVTEVTHLRNVMHSHAALGSILRGVPPVDNVLDLDNLVIIYNRVPKTGSTSFIGLAYDLCAKNKFNVLHINTTKNMPTLSLTDQMRFVYNVSNWLEKKPGIYHGHIAYLDFNRLFMKPLMISRTPCKVKLKLLFEAEFICWFFSGISFLTYFVIHAASNDESDSMGSEVEAVN